MPRTVPELEAAARSLKHGEKFVLSTAEAQALVTHHQNAAVARGKKRPDTQYLMKKAASGKASMFGHLLEVK
jgi:hypothetical protein